MDVRDPLTTRPSLFDESGEGGLIMHGKIGEDLAVHLDPGLGQAVNKSAIGQAEVTGRGVDALDPQGAEIPLLGAPVAIGILVGLLDRLHRDAENVLATAEIALRLLDDLLVRLARNGPLWNVACVSLLVSARVGHVDLDQALVARARIVVPRWLRICLLVRLIMPWRLPACPALILPEAVVLNRFLAEDLVFILGILLSPFKALLSRHGMPFTGQAA